MKKNSIYFLILTILINNTFAADHNVEIIGDGGSTGTRLFFFDSACE